MTEVSTTASAPGGAIVRPVQSFSALIHVDVTALSHQGHVRANNEDQFYVARLTRSLETLMSSVTDREVLGRADEVNYVMVVADGMGGHAAGEVASAMTIRALVSLALKIPDWIFRVDEAHAEELQRRARDIVKQIDAILVERGRRDSTLRGMGSTLTFARSCGRDLLLVHVGDSRAYLLRSGRLHRLTKDHTYAQMLVDIGRLEPSKVTGSGVGHILTNALGGSSETVDVDVDLLTLENGDRLLLCTDGLSDLVADDTITETFLGARSSADACKQLLQLALERGGRDNVTAIVAAYEIPAEPDSVSS
jgi:protein phosphatase